MVARTLVNQDYSARSRAIEAELTGQGTKANVLVTVGVTPEAVEGGGTVNVVHFCSSRLFVQELIVPGSSALLLPQQCPVTISRGLPLLRNASIVRCPPTLESEGGLSFRFRAQDALVVKIPDIFLQEAPWAYEGGAEDVAELMTGVRDLNVLFRKCGLTLAC